MFDNDTKTYFYDYTLISEHCHFVTQNAHKHFFWNRKINHADLIELHVCPIILARNQLDVK